VTARRDGGELGWGEGGEAGEERMSEELEEEDPVFDENGDETKPLSNKDRGLIDHADCGTKGYQSEYHSPLHVLFDVLARLRERLGVDECSDIDMAMHTQLTHIHDVSFIAGYRQAWADVARIAMGETLPPRPPVWCARDENPFEPPEVKVVKVAKQRVRRRTKTGTANSGRLAK
jgi:hypothetical protein